MENLIRRDNLTDEVVTRRGLRDVTIERKLATSNNPYILKDYLDNEITQVTSVGAKKETLVVNLVANVNFPINTTLFSSNEIKSFFVTHGNINITDSLLFTNISSVWNIKSNTSLNNVTVEILG